MSYSIGDFLSLIGSLGLFLYGMKVMSEGLQKVAGEKMRTVLSAMTSNRFWGILTGVVVTAVIQSSSATTIMVVSFVNAGLLNLAQAISVIMGANIGTTATVWIISLLGFKVDISAFAIPLLAFSLPLIFSSKSNWKSWGEFIIGFSLLFLGLEYLKSSMPDLQSNPELLSSLQSYANLGYPSIILFLFIGAVMTLLVQSSSATVALTLIMCAKGWIPFEIAAAMILGENIGTTITANLGALNANVAAKRAAFSHFLFNVFGVCVVLLVFYPFINLIVAIMDGMGAGNPNEIFSYIKELSTQYDVQTMSILTSNNPIADPALQAIQSRIMSLTLTVSLGLSLFHTLFNFTNMLIMVWLIPLYVRICTALIKPSKKEKREGSANTHLQYISMGMLSTAELSLVQAHKEMALYGQRVARMIDMNEELLKDPLSSHFMEIYNRIEKYENICDNMEVEIANYLTKISQGRLSASSKEDVMVLMRAATEIESVGDACYNIAKSQKILKDEELFFTDEIKQNIESLLALTREAILRMNEVLNMETVTSSSIHETYNIENRINNFTHDLQNKNIKDVQEGKYEYRQSVHYMDIVDECESLGDYVLNVVQAIVEKKV